MGGCDPGGVVLKEAFTHAAPHQTFVNPNIGQRKSPNQLCPQRDSEVADIAKERQAHQRSVAAAAWEPGFF